MAKEIELQNGMKAIVDDEDFERVNQFIWTCFEKRLKTGISVARFDKKTRVTLSYFILNQEIKRGKGVVFKNKNRLDHRKSNLMIRSFKETLHMSKSSRGSSSKYKGVGWHKRTKKWRAVINVERKVIHLGLFESEDEAALAYNKASLKYFGIHSYQNIIGIDNSVATVELDKSPNVRRVSKNRFKTSEYRGVCLRSTGKWQAQITTNRKVTYLGCAFDTEAEAAKAYNKAAIELFGDQAILNDLEGME